MRCSVVVLAMFVAGCATSTARSSGPAVATSTSNSTPPVTNAPKARAVTTARLEVAPSPRILASMTFDPLTKSVVLFGGYGPWGTFDDTWSWDGTRWRQLHPDTSASGRANAAMVYDPALRQVLMLSGGAEVPLTDPCQRRAGRAPVCVAPAMFRDVSPGTDLWGWDGHRWMQRAVADVGAPDPQGGMVSQPDGAMLVVAGTSTWTYDGQSWTNRTHGTDTMQSPVGIAIDPVSVRLIAVERYQPGVCMPHSGCAQPAYMRTFTWTGAAWKDVADVGTPDPAGSGQRISGLVPDPAGGALLMLAADHSTWERASNGHWRQVATAAESPPALEGMTLVADSAAHQVVGFGGARIGHGSAFAANNDTWVWNGSTWAELTAPITPAPLPSPPAATDCTLNGPSLIPNQQPAAGGVIRITVSSLFVTPPCRLRATVSLTLEGANGTPLAIAGNPSTVTIDSTGPAGASVLTGAWIWTNACAAPPVRAFVQATGAGAFPTPFPLDLTGVRGCARNATSSLRSEQFVIGAGGK
ncbi:MAG: hypothetical protein QOF59_347 [Actinomycetota bacterium]|nr:hypothetical protein [Actinomycetota bacterium]